MADHAVEVDMYCSDDLCLNCKNVLRRGKRKSDSVVRGADYAVSEQRRRFYASLPLENNPFKPELLEVAGVLEPKLCASCQKDFRAYSQVHGNNCARKRISCENDSAVLNVPHPKTRKVGSVRVEWDSNQNMRNARWRAGANDAARGVVSASKGKGHSCIVCGAHSSEMQGKGVVRLYNANIGREILRNVEEDHLLQFVESAFRKLCSRRERLTGSRIQNTLCGCSEGDHLCGVCIQSLRRERDRVEREACSVCQREVNKTTLQKLVNAHLLNDEAHVFGTITNDMLSVRLQGHTSENIYRGARSHAGALLNGTYTACNACRIFFRRFVGRFLGNSTEHGHETFLDRVVCWLEYEVLGPQRVGVTKNMTDVYTLYKSVTEAAWRLQIGAKGTNKVMGYRTFKDAITASARFSVITDTAMPDGRRGACVCSEQTLRQLLAVGLRHHKRDVEQAVSTHEISSDLKTVAKRYKEMGLTRNTTDQHNYDLVKEIEIIPTRLWSFWVGFISPRRLQRDRKRLLQQHDGDISRLPFPHNNKCGLNIAILNGLCRHDYRVVTRVLMSIQSATFSVDSKAVGPMVWSFSCTLFSKGGDMVLRLCNAAGFTVHPNTLRHLKESVLTRRRNSQLSELVRSNTFTAFAFDNIDAELAVNVIADTQYGKLLDRNT